MADRGQLDGSGTSPEPLFSVNAVNLAEHSGNPVHTAEGGIAAGFGGAIVAGTTVYAYLARAAVELYGPDWATHGGGTLTLRVPVLAEALVEVRLLEDRLAACVGDMECARLLPRAPQERADGAQSEPIGPWAAVSAVLPHEGNALAEATRRPIGKAFEPMSVELDEHLTGYAVRCGETDPRYGEMDLVHPVVWPLLANAVFARHLVRGPWVHTRSDIFHLGQPAPGDTVVIEATEIDRFSRSSGERAVVAMRFTVDGELVTLLEHEAII